MKNVRKNLGTSTFFFQTGEYDTPRKENSDKYKSVQKGLTNV